MKKVIFTDLDGTLIDFQNYSFSASLEAVQRVKEAGIPVVFCSSKTRVEQEFYLDAMGIRDPIIVENGSAIFIPKGYFNFEFDYQREDNNYQIIELGVPFHIIRSVLDETRQFLGFKAHGYSDLPITKVMQLTGLSESFARNAAQREYSETILIKEDDELKFSSFISTLEGKNMSCISGGKFHTIISRDSNKGKALRILKTLFDRHFGGKTESIGIGDSANDLPLLNSVDRPFLVQKPPGNWTDFSAKGIRKIPAIGPNGWTKMAQEILQ